MTYREYSNVPMMASGRTCPSLTLVYAATTAGGVFYTDSFTGSGAQPLWTDVSAGLGALDCKEFHVDPFAPDSRQFVLIESEDTLYRRENGGSWVAILTPADLSTLVGYDDNDVTIGGFFTDPSIDGRVWVSCVGMKDHLGHSMPYVDAAYSDDYGDTWTAVAYIYWADQFLGLGSIQACGNNVWVGVDCRANGWTGGRLFNSGDMGGSWNDGIVNSVPYFGHFNPLLTSTIYTSHNGTNLGRMAIGGVVTDLVAIGDLQRGDAMWFDIADSDHQRLIYDYMLYVTTDEWSTMNSPSVISNEPVGLAQHTGADIDDILLALTVSHGFPTFQEHVIGVIDDESGTTSVGIAGPYPDTPPYTDSIPYTAVSICRSGIQVIVT